MQASCLSLRKILNHQIDVRSLLARRGVVRTRNGRAPSRRLFRSPCRLVLTAFANNSWLSCRDLPHRRRILARSVSSTGRSNNDETKDKPDDQDDSTLSAAPPTSTGTPSLSLRQQARSPPNVITLARIACTPLLSYCIMNDYSTAALVGCFLAGTSDLLDGWLARNFQQTTVLGTYLDPLADKILINTLSISLWYQGILPTPLVVLWLTRDIALMVGSYKYVLRSETKTTVSAKKDSNSYSSDQPSPSQSTQHYTRFEETATWIKLPRTTLQVKPSSVSKVNTALQFLTLGAAIASPMYMLTDPTAVATGDVLGYAASWDDNVLLQSLCWMTGATTLVSGFDYLNRDVFKR